jgi:hypothetical protein
MGKLQACAWFYRWEMPKCVHWHRLLDTMDRTTLEMQDGWF